jgi:hypothetical protein
MPVSNNAPKRVQTQQNERECTENDYNRLQIAPDFRPNELTVATRLVGWTTGDLG